MLTYDQLMTWNPGKLSGIADRINSGRKRMIDQQDELDAGEIPPDWTGAAAERARLRHRNLRDQINDLVAPAPPIIEALDHTAEVGKTSQKQARAAREAIIAKGWKVESATSRTVLTSPPSEAELDGKTQEEIDALEGQVREFVQDLLDALQKADQAGIDFATVLRNARRGAYDGGTGSLSQAGLPPELRGLSDEEIATRIVMDPEKYEGYVDTLTPAQQKAVGSAIAQEVETTFGPDERPTQREVNRANQLMAMSAANSGVAAGLFGKLGASGTVDTMERIEYLMSTTQITGLDDAAGLVRSGLVSASHDSSFPDHYFGKQIGENASPSVVAYLMKDHGYDGPFVRGAAEGFDPRDRNAEQPVVMTTPSPLLGETSGYVRIDPMGEIIGALGEHPQEGLDFFADEVGEKRAAYYFGDRDWSHDGYATITEFAANVGTDAQLGQQHPKDLAMFTSRFFDEIADNQGFTPEGAKDASPNMARLLGSNLPSVTAAMDGRDGGPGIYDHALPFQGSDGETVRLEDLPMINGDDLDRLMQVAVAREDGASEMGQRIGFYQQTLLNTAAETDGSPTAIKATIQDTAKLSGFAEYSAGQIEIDDAAEQDKRRKQMIDAISFGAKIVPLPGPGEDIAGGLAKNFVDEGISKARDGMSASALKEFGSEADGATAEANDAAAAHLADVKARTFYAMVNAGVLDIAGDDLFDQDGDGVPTPFADLNPASAISSIDAILAREGIMTEHDFKSAYEDPFVEFRTGKGTP
ncbi:DUF6571 family protein [Nocardioides sp. NPDC006273]|uniref:DUF6571 family protein n=1 Tax=Nocardioides sp. NPDC006273 TaxID=3155598 RepID=UPI0033ACBA0A